MSTPGYAPASGGIAGLIRGGAATPSTAPRTTTSAHMVIDGFDLVWSQTRLSEQMQAIETEIRAIESNANLSDTERMFAMQTAMNSWSAVSNLRTNMLKSVSDTLKTIVRNVA